MRSTFRIMTAEAKAELAARHRNEWPELWTRIDALDELLPLLRAPTL